MVYLPLFLLFPFKHGKELAAAEIIQYGVVAGRCFRCALSSSFVFTEEVLKDCMIINLWLMQLINGKGRCVACSPSGSSVVTEEPAEPTGWSNLVTLTAAA